MAEIPPCDVIDFDAMSTKMIIALNDGWKWPKNSAFHHRLHDFATIAVLFSVPSRKSSIEQTNQRYVGNQCYPKCTPLSVRNN